MSGHDVATALGLIGNGDPYLYGLLWATVRVVLISTGAAVLLGVPAALALGLGRFRGRRLLRALAGAGLALPPVVVGVVVLLLTIPQAGLASLHLAFTMTGVYVVQTVLALPYVIALGASAVEALDPGLLDQARSLGAGPRQLAVLALAEARVGLLAATVAAAGAVVAEVGAVVIVGGNIDGHSQTLASALLAQFNGYSNNGEALAITLVLGALILLIAALATGLQLRRPGGRLRRGPAGLRLGARG